MSHIHFVGGEKGGVGKSVVSRLLAQWFLDRGIPFAAVDADTSHRTLLRAYGNHTQPVDLEVFDSADEIVNRALAAERRVVVDLPAQASRLLERWVESTHLIRFAQETGIRLTLWHVTDGTFDSVKDLERAMNRFGDQLGYIVAKNSGRSKDFSQFDATEPHRRLEHLGGRVVEIPELDQAAMHKIDRMSASFWAAANNSGGDGPFAPMQRQRVRLWLERCYERLAALGDAL